MPSAGEKSVHICVLEGGQESVPGNAVDCESARIAAQAEPSDEAGKVSALQSLRNQLWESASTLTAHHGLGDRVIS